MKSFQASKKHLSQSHYIPKTTQAPKRPRIVQCSTELRGDKISFKWVLRLSLFSLAGQINHSQLVTNWIDFVESGGTEQFVWRTISAKLIKAALGGELPRKMDLPEVYKSMARLELREEESRKKQALEQFREWICKQGHIEHCRTGLDVAFLEPASVTRSLFAF